MKFKKMSMALALSGVLATPLAAQDLKIGFITTLSGPAGYFGQDARDAFNLAIEHGGGTLGGAKINLLVEDDAVKPGQGKQIADRFLKGEGVKLFTGIIFSNVSAAIVPDILDGGGTYVSLNAAPSEFAGKECHRNYFVMSWQNDSLHESAGANATRLGYKRAFLIAPNYQAGKDAIAGFKRYFKGTIAGEVYTVLNATDYAAEIARIRASDADMVFHFIPGGAGIAFARQYAAAGLKLPQVVSGASGDSVIVKAVGEPFLGTAVSAQWSSDLDNPVNKKFVEDFQKKYGRVPTQWAAQAYDTALGIASALKANGGKFETNAFRTALLKADFQLTRGPFKFAPNQHPIQDWYAMTVVKNGENFALKLDQKILTNHTDVYGKDCKM
jgi:branched-chain amino acid transport system substrate-binding protein